MIRATRLVVSQPMYAFDPETWTHADHGGYEVAAAWFKRKNSALVATIGTYRPAVERLGTEPADGTYESWIAAADDNRYGGYHLASWNGQALLNSDQPVTEAETVRRIRFLDAMLRGFPDAPAGYDGWWTFERRPRRAA